MSNQVFNPFLPLYEYVPDGEPHVFNDRLYLYGSHDREGGHTFCMEDYVVYSAPVSDLTNWRFEGVSYRAEQDPDHDRLPYLFAPDVVCGNDGRYYLYYCLGGEYGYGGYSGHISVAVGDSPAGPFEYIGFVRNPDGSPMDRYVCFDPAVINDDGVIRVYYGTQYPFEEEPDFREREDLIEKEAEVLGTTKERVLSYPDSINGPNMLTLEDDMLTVREEARHILPYPTKGTEFEKHPFFEASSIRKIGNTYYFIYSSWNNHELCYATSDKPDRDYTYGGTIVSNGDVGINGHSEEDRMNMTGTTHGSIVCADGQWYVFYHRLTHKSDYSRQACAEKITIEADGTIRQAEMTSCGLNPGPLSAWGEYPAVIACNITDGHMPHGTNSVYAKAFPHVTHRVFSGESRAQRGTSCLGTANDPEKENGAERFIAEISDGTLIGFKYFKFEGKTTVQVEFRPETPKNRPHFDGPFRLDERVGGDGETYNDTEKNKSSDISDNLSKTVYFDILTEERGEPVGLIDLRMTVDEEDPFTWTIQSGEIEVSGESALYLKYHGCGRIQLKSLSFL